MELNGSITAGGALYGAFGTDSGNYNDLRNKPSINGVELVGNKTSEDLHIDPGGTTDYEDLENKPQINYTPLEGNLTLDDLDIQSKIDFPADPTRFLDGAGQFRSPDYFSGDYDDLANRPEIAGITLTGDKSLTDLGIQEEINFPSDNTKYLDGEGNFTTPAYFSGDYDDLANRPEIAGITLSGNQSLTDLGIQAEIDFPGDNTLFLNGNGNFTQPNYFSGDYDDLTDKPQINSVTLEGNKTASDLKLISEIHTASGSEAAIETDDTLPLLSCISDINPVQDLHGYSKPWAGGAGKNKCFNALGNVQSENAYLYPQGDGLTITVNNSTRTAYAKVAQNTDIVFSCDENPQRYIAYGLDAYPDVNVICHTLTITQLASNQYKFNSGSYEYVAFYYCNDVLNVPDDVMIEQNTQATTYEPYSNICPISGHTDVTVTVASTSGGSGDDTTVSLGRTVYGGTLDVTKGELVVNKASSDLGDLSWVKSAEGRFQSTSLNGIIAANTGAEMPNMECSVYEVYRAGAGTTIGITAFTEGGTSYIRCIDSSYADAPSFTNGVRGQTICYELATPQNFTLTKEQIVTLLGDNYIRSDTGDIEITFVTNVIDPLLKYLLENR